MRLDSTKLVLAGVVAAIMLGGCGKKAPTAVARTAPIEDQAVANPALPAADQAAPVAQDPAPVTGAYEDVPAAPAATAPAAPAEADDAAEAKAAEEAAAKKQAEEAAARKAAEEAAAEKKAQEEAAAKKQAEEAAARKAAEEAAAKKKAEEEAAAKKAEEEARARAEKLVRQTPAFAKLLGEGGMHATTGIAVAGDRLFVVDSNRQGLLGKFAAVREYDLGTGEFVRSYENIGWAGAKNLPTSVDRVKIVDGNVVAANGSTSWTFDAEGKLIKTEDTSFEQATQVDGPGSNDTYRIAGGKIERLEDDGDVIVAFGSDELDVPVALALGADGKLYVTEKTKAKVVVFAKPAE